MKKELIDIYNVSLNEINKINDINLRKHYTKLYKCEIKSILKTKFGKKVLDSEYYNIDNCSLNYLYNKLLCLEQEHCSNYFFSGDTVLFYPYLKESKSKNYIVCNYSGSVINAGSYYITYRPFLHNISNNKRYVLEKSFKCETGYLHNLPNNLYEFEEVQFKIMASEETRDEYYDILCNYGDFNLKELKYQKKLVKTP